MNKLLRLSLLIVMTCMTMRSVAQSIASPLSEFDQAVRIGLVDEFFDRFNGLSSNKALDNPDRKKSLLILFNLEQFPSFEHPRFTEASDMAERIINDSIKINYSDSCWLALAHCKGVLNNREVKFDVFLNVESRGEDMYKWTITKVAGKLFDIAPENTHELNMLYPDDHETNFMSLGRMTSEQPENVLCFMGKDFEYDATSVFAYLVYNKSLRITGVENLEFVFTQVPGYMFHVKYFNRQGNNAGWLISDFYASSPEDKEAFLEYAGAKRRIINDEKKNEPLQ